jgi:hypothetical protein
MRSWQDELEEGDDERTTGYVIETLGEDIDKAFRRLSKNFVNHEPDGAEYDESDAREYYRAVFAYIEGASFSLRMSSAAQLLEKGTLDIEERVVLGESTLDIQNGEVIHKPMKVSLEENVKFAFRLADRAHDKGAPTLDTGGHWWSDFRKATRVRDRITHPRLPKDLDISPDEVMLITKVDFGFRELMGSFLSTQSQSE